MLWWKYSIIFSKIVLVNSTQIGISAKNFTLILRSFLLLFSIDFPHRTSPSGLTVKQLLQFLGRSEFLCDLEYQLEVTALPIFQKRIEKEIQLSQLFFSFAMTIVVIFFKDTFDFFNNAIVNIYVVEYRILRKHINKC